ncbi:uncharacterized protein METZ01_LOCUS311234, partial [marine metagenome]
MIDATHIRLECLKLANGNITLAKEYLTFVTILPEVTIEM